MRRFPPPWTIDDLPGGYVVRDASGQRLAYVYGRQDTAGISDALSLEEARRIATGIARLPSLLEATQKGGEADSR